MGVAEASDLPVHAPEPLAAHQRRLRAGADTTDATISSSTLSAMRVAHTGTPRRKFAVPSIGSMIQRRGPSPVSARSSPCTASRERIRDKVRRTESSTARSASVTSERSGLVETVRSLAPNRDIVKESASSARMCARRRSSVWSAMSSPYWCGCGIKGTKTRVACDRRP